MFFGVPVTSWFERLYSKASLFNTRKKSQDWKTMACVSQTGCSKKTKMGRKNFYVELLLA